MNKKRAFTIIELLVVISVIILLAALLLPALNRAKIAADSAACRSNLRQLMVGTSLYVQQIGAYPLGEWWPIELPPMMGARWPEDNFSFTNFSYLGARQNVFACPGYNRVRGWFSLATQASGAASISAGSYAYNAYGWLNAWEFEPPTELWNQGLGGIDLTPGSYLNPADVKATPENRVLSPADMISFGDAPFLRPDQAVQTREPPGGTLLYSKAFSSSPFSSFYNEVVRNIAFNATDPTVRQTLARHGGRWNVGFCDAHVENLRGKQLFDFSNPMVARRWNSDHQPHNTGWVVPSP